MTCPTIEVSYVESLRNMWMMHILIKTWTQMRKKILFTNARYNCKVFCCTLFAFYKPAKKKVNKQNIWNLYNDFQLFLTIWILLILIRAAGYIACDCHAYLISKAGSVISNKSPSRAFRWVQHYQHRAVVLWQAMQYHVHYRFICDSECELRSLSENYGSVY